MLLVLSQWKKPSDDPQIATHLSNAEKRHLILVRNFLRLQFVGQDEIKQTWTDWSLVLPKWTELVLCWGHLVHCEINHLFWEKCLPNGSTGWTRAHCRPIFVNVDLSHVAYSICNPITGHFLHSLPNSVACYKGQAFHLSFTSAHLQDPSQYCPNWCIASN